MCHSSLSSLSYNRSMFMCLLQSCVPFVLATALQPRACYILILTIICLCAEALRLHPPPKCPCVLLHECANIRSLGPFLLLDPFMQVLRSSPPPRCLCMLLRLCCPQIRCSWLLRSPWLGSGAPRRSWRSWAPVRRTAC